MGELLRRRAMMAAASGGGGDEPLYGFKNGSISPANGTGNVTVSDGNHIRFAQSRRGATTGAYLRSDMITKAAPADVSPMFTLQSGDVVITKFKNFVITDASVNKVDFFAYTLDNVKIGLGQLIATNGNSTPIADIELTDVIGETTEVGFYRIFKDNSTSNWNTSLIIEFDVEVYVNGVRYI